MYGGNCDLSFCSWYKNSNPAINIKTQTLHRLRLCIQIMSKDSQVKTQLVLWIFILFKVTRWQHVSASVARPSSGHK